jgi:hypothetical protein
VETLSKMLATLDSERFCSGHSDTADRAAVVDCIERMKLSQAKVKALVEQGKGVAETQSQSDGGEGRLIQTIYQELQNSPG